MENMALYEIVIEKLAYGGDGLAHLPVFSHPDTNHSCGFTTHCSISQRIERCVGNAPLYRRKNG